MKHRWDEESAPSQFRTTAWSIIATAQDHGSRDYEECLQHLCKRYWKPIYYYIRRRGVLHERALDLTQDYFTAFLEKDFLHSVDPARGRFRTFILTTLTRFLSKEYKKAHRRVPTVPLSITSPDAERELDRSELSDAETPEDVFNRSWARNLIEQTVRRMQETCTHGKAREYCRVFIAFIESATDMSPKSYRELGASLSLSETDVTNYLHRGRNIFQKLLRSEVRQSVSRESQLDEELEELRRYFV
ncbi:MAG: hypothetical protein V1918_06360 [Planctomycetota bacterium]